MDFKNLLLKSINSSILGGNAIMDIYLSDYKIEIKEDQSPLTIADKKCNDIICKELAETEIPILSEEGSKITYIERKNWEYFWLVDPLDGTKEFIKRNGEFTVNIALIYKQKPIMGVIYVPATKVLYFGLENMGSYKKDKITLKHINDDLDELLKSCKKLPIKNNQNNFTIVGSRSHMSHETELFFNKMKKKYNNVNLMSVGSSLKLCMVAEGKANVYPRYAPTMEWDTAAGHAIVKYAGFSVKKYNSTKELIYNKKNLLNPWFLVE
ncbi:MAG: 3'(2'),5'-bisphosphate nucleotidase [Flavobacteriales bacterium]|nr:3'(2'),5'-bisphosphate nucleotidase [Flavobacteriales bacterium]